MSIYGEQQQGRILINYFVAPLYTFLIYYIFIFLLKNKSSFLFVSTIHILISGTILLLFVLVPLLRGNKNNDISHQERYELLQKVYDAYVVAHEGRESNEANFYVDVIENFFPEDTRLLSDSVSKISISRKDTQYIQSFSDTINESIERVEQLTVLNFYNLDAGEMARAIDDLIVAEKYYAAQYLLFRYITIFGINSETELIRNRIQGYIDNFFNKEQRSLIELESHLVYLRDVLYSSDSLELDILAGYRTLVALQNIYSSHADIEGLLAKYKETLDAFTFFAGEARKVFLVDMLERRHKKPLHFIDENEEGKLIISAQNVSVSAGSVYFKDIELLQLDDHETLQWHIKTPYAKLTKNKIHIYAIEENSMVIYHPQIVEGEYTQNIWYMPSAVSVEDIAYLMVDPFKVNLWAQVRIYPVWKKYYFPINVLFVNGILILFSVALFIFGGYGAMIFAYSVLIQAQKREEKRKQASFGIICISMSIIPFSVFMVSLILYVSQIISIAYFSILGYGLLALFVLMFSLLICISQIQSKRYAMYSQVG